MSDTFWYKHGLEADEIAYLVRDGANHLNAWHLACLMLLENLEVNDLEDVKQHFTYIEKWFVDPDAFKKGLERRKIKIKRDIESVKKNRNNGKIGAEKRWRNRENG